MLLKTLISNPCCVPLQMLGAALDGAMAQQSCLPRAGCARDAGGSNCWVLHWLVALMEAAGGHLEALEWLLHQVDRCIASQSTEGKGLLNSLVFAAGA